MRRTALSDELFLFLGGRAAFWITGGYSHEMEGNILHLGKNHERARDKGPDFLGPNSNWLGQNNSHQLEWTTHSYKTNCSKLFQKSLATLFLGAQSRNAVSKCEYSPAARIRFMIKRVSSALFSSFPLALETN